MPASQGKLEAPTGINMGNEGFEIKKTHVPKVPGRIIFGKAGHDDVYLGFRNRFIMIRKAFFDCYFGGGNCIGFAVGPVNRGRGSGVWGIEVKVEVKVG